MLKDIVEWNEERNLLMYPKLRNETEFIIEELIEMVSPLTSEEARIEAKEIADTIMTLGSGFEPGNHRIVDAACDVIVFATGIIAKMGYDPDKCMDEVMKELNSREGEITDGKWIKNKTPEAKAKWHKANFDHCRISKD